MGLGAKQEASGRAEPLKEHHSYNCNRGACAMGFPCDGVKDLWVDKETGEIYNVYGIVVGVVGE